MRKFILVLSKVLVIAIFSSIFFPSLTVNAKELLQTNNTIQASGQICALDNSSQCGSFDFTFPVGGGDIAGSYNLTYTNTGGDGKVYTYHENATLAGTYSGGDGGTITGTFSTHLVNSVSTDVFYGTWEGTLSSDGTGHGTISAKGMTNTWQVTFSASEFQTAINEFNGIDSSSTVTEEPAILPTPTSNEVVGKKFNLLPETKEFIASSPTISEATKAIFQQDAAIIVRDENNQFFTVGNDGKSIALPSELNSYFSISNQFAVLGNDNWLASSEFGSVRGTINGGGDFVLMDKIPPELKEHDYTMLATNCASPTECSPVMKINSTASSTKVFATCLMPQRDSSQTGMNQGEIYYISSPGGRIASSEHGSCRGTINGGGDFIYQPQPIMMASYIRSSTAISQKAANPGYLGILVENLSDGAEIQQIQNGSPAFTAGLEIGDLIANVSGTPLDDQHTLSSVLAQYSGGEEVILGIIRNDQISAINLTLATMTAPVIETPTATITLTDKTELVVDIGFNGVTGILVLADSAHVFEPVSGTDIEVPAGSAVIVVPGESLDTVYTMTDADINKWWENPSNEDTAPPIRTNPTVNTTTTYQGYKDFNPIPGVDAQTLYWVFCFGLGVIYLIILLVLILKK